MQANLENLSTLERRLSVTLPAAEIASEVENRLKRLTRTIRMPGFRPGKAPLKVIAQQYGTQVRQEVLGDAMQKSFGEAVRQQNLKVAGMPRFDAKPLTEGSADFQYSAVFEIYPDVVVGSIADATISRPVLEVGEADVDRTLEIMRKQRARYEPAGRATQEGDQLTIDYRGTIGGEEFAGGGGKDQTVQLGGGRLLPGFERNLAGMSEGETKTFELRFPDDYHGKEVAGKTAQFEVVVKRVAAPRLPDVDAGFARSLGVEDGDLAKMRAEIRANLEREIRARLKSRTKDQVMQALLDSTRIETPRTLVQTEAQRLQMAAREDLAARGIPVTDNVPPPHDLFEKQALRRVNLGLILGEVVKMHDLHARPEQVRSHVEEQAQSYERPEEVVKWFYASPDRLRDVESLVMEENIVAWALGVARVRDQATNFDELMGR